MAVLLIWWGAATTTEQAGMVFPDWPLSLGSINPPGWLNFLPPFLEHSHRLFATTVGMMTLTLFGWAYVRSGRDFLELAILVLWLGLITGLFATGGAERQDAGRKSTFLLLGAAAGLAPVAWLIVGWTRRNWTLCAKLTALALLMVTLQAILGGLRVTEISDNFAVVHGCLAQAFFCLLILIAMLSARGWKEAPRRDCLSEPCHRRAKIWAKILVAAVFSQLVLGALMRHHHRHGLADTGILKTAGKWIPAFDPPEVGILFLHKYWAVAVFCAGLGLTGWLWRRQTVPVGLLRHSLMISILLVAQLTLGVSILLTGNPEHKSFWITNFHVLNGLAILALCFALAVRCSRANRDRTLLAADSGSNSESLPERSP